MFLVGDANTVWSKKPFIFIYLIKSSFSSTFQYPRGLQIEYEQLKEQHLRRGINPLASPPDCAVSPQHASEDAELIAEAKLLRQHKGRLEARMQILEDHNKQLESQLHRLRQLLEQVLVHFAPLLFLHNRFHGGAKTWTFYCRYFHHALLVCCNQSFPMGYFILPTSITHG